MEARTCVFIIISVAIILASSGCVGTPGCLDTGCPDICSGNVLLTKGKCTNGECMYSFSECEFGCNGSSCTQPDMLSIGDNPSTRGNFTLKVTRSYVMPGSEPLEDMYAFTLTVSKHGTGIESFSVLGASIVSESGIMHSTEDLSWSDSYAEGETRKIDFVIRDVPVSRRDQELTLIIRTADGYFSFPATFIAADRQ